MEVVWTDPAIHPLSHRVNGDTTPKRDEARLSERSLPDPSAGKCRGSGVAGALQHADAVLEVEVELHRGHRERHELQIDPAAGIVDGGGAFLAGSQPHRATAPRHLARHRELEGDGVAAVVVRRGLEPE